MLYIAADKNPSSNVAELHLQEHEDITIILPDGTEIYVSGDGTARNQYGQLLEETYE
jgi:hypothetical protein